MKENWKRNIKIHFSFPFHNMFEKEMKMEKLMFQVQHKKEVFFTPRFL